MEQFDYKFHRGRKPTFDDAPASKRRRAFGVDYLHLRGLQSGDLWVTRHGWPLVESLLPSVWFADSRFSKVGRALAGATGAVYRMPAPHSLRNEIALVVKFSRAAQDVGLTLVDQESLLDSEERERNTDARFLSPFAEFGNLELLRRSAPHIRTSRPLAIYAPATRYLAWRLGRQEHACHSMDLELAQAQDGMPENQLLRYEWERLYILLYLWVDGIDAEQAMQSGLLTMEEMVALGMSARACLRDAGWLVCDHKPRHVIVRPLPGRRLLRRRETPVWALIDYELLIPRSR